MLLGICAPVPLITVFSVSIAPSGSVARRPVYRTLGKTELLEALYPGEEIRLVTPASTWASPRAILALSERRFLWLLDDAPVARVRSVPLRDVESIEHRTRRKRASLTIRTLTGRRHAFHELRPHTAVSIERYLARDRP